MFTFKEFLELKKCEWCNEKAEYAFVGKTFDNEYKHVFLCIKHHRELMNESRNQGIKREKGLAKKYFDGLKQQENF